eukprot:SAG22_NODE_1_length_62449_cov_158.689270_50_plen_553_part_00
MNLNPLQHWQLADGNNSAGMTEVKYINGLYNLWDGIRAKFPGLWVDNCASGGRRIDLETMRRSVPLWRSDFGDATTPGGSNEPDNEAFQAMSMGLTQFAPINSGLISTQSGYNEYTWRSQGIAGKVLFPPAKVPWPNITKLKQGIAETQRLREFVIDPDVDYYPLTPIVRDPGIWAAYQFHRAANSSGFVMVFRRRSANLKNMTVHLRGLAAAPIAANRQFAVRACPTFECEEKAMTRAELSALSVTLDRPQSSILYEYRLQSLATKTDDVSMMKNDDKNLAAPAISVALFLDSWWLASSDGLRTQIGTPELLSVYRDPNATNYVGWGYPSVFRTTSGLWRMVYQADISTCPQKALLAESDNAIDWRPAALEHRGSQTGVESRCLATDRNLLFWLGQGIYPKNLSNVAEQSFVYEDPEASAPGERLNMLLSNTTRLTSADGHRWQHSGRWQKSTIDPGFSVFRNPARGNELTVEARPVKLRAKGRHVGLHAGQSWAELAAADPAQCFPVDGQAYRNDDQVYGMPTFAYGGAADIVVMAVPLHAKDQKQRSKL